jgi:hypothetical protein
VEDATHLYGRAEKFTIVVRSHEARLTDFVGDLPAALRMFEALIPEVRSLPSDDPDRLMIELNYAERVRKAGQPERALVLFQALVPQVEQVLGPDHRETLAARAGLAGSYGDCNNPIAARQQYERLLSDRTRVLRKNDPQICRIDSKGTG